MMVRLKGKFMTTVIIDLLRKLTNKMKTKENTLLKRLTDISSY